MIAEGSADQATARFNVARAMLAVQLNGCASSRKLEPLATLDQIFPRSTIRMRKLGPELASDPIVVRFVHHEWAKSTGNTAFFATFWT